MHTGVAHQPQEVAGFNAQPTHNIPNRKILSRRRWSRKAGPLVLYGKLFRFNVTCAAGHGVQSVARKDPRRQNGERKKEYIQ
ncbi:hypothetical protein T265_07664 [Opisthorchis viverrini]|uniref:Uncharacterized protein n=1 Tax=Opisthorchis viverrini TaxID=6198 RepID=A0A074ZN63_OPIVI|nr:hypothetical protein T265_07664 [Opisthorchis viverrini]KER24780.1 hypothetical protein T265_07664 [Opisthorchis viverrini]